jgi:hypothetical protein
MDAQQELDIPTLQSFFTHLWKGESKSSADTSYFPAEHDDSDGSSDEWEGASESSLSSIDSEDSNMNEDGYVQLLIQMRSITLI